jgi:2-oxoglutarate dehydrogenase E2 component (dihydrolipoamide succinyltransferase)
MAIVEVKVPQLSESVAEATMLQWKKKVGDTVAADEILIEIEPTKWCWKYPPPRPVFCLKSWWVMVAPSRPSS